MFSTLLVTYIQHGRYIFKYNFTGSSYKLTQLINFTIGCQNLLSWLHIYNSCYLATASVVHQNKKGKERKREVIKTKFISFEMLPKIRPPFLHCSWLKIRRWQISRRVRFASNFCCHILVYFFLIPTHSKCLLIKK